MGDDRESRTVPGRNDSAEMEMLGTGLILIGALLGAILSAARPKAKPVYIPVRSSPDRRRRHKAS